MRTRRKFAYPLEKRRSRQIRVIEVRRVQHGSAELYWQSSEFAANLVLFKRVRPNRLVVVGVAVSVVHERSTSSERTRPAAAIRENSSIRSRVMQHVSLAWPLRGVGASGKSTIESRLPCRPGCIKPRDVQF